MRHFIDLSQWSSEELRQMIDLAVQLKREWQNGGNEPLLRGKTLGLIFQKPSLRTRVSFEVGMRHLGGEAITLGPDEIGFGKRESVGDIARVMSGYVQAIMARVFDHAHVEELAAYSSVPVINGLSDEQHPCQAMADMMTIYERFGRTENLRVAFVGDGNNVAVSLAQVSAHFGAHFSVATPPGYEISEAALDPIGEIAARNGSTISTYHSPQAAVEGADVIYTDTWVSMGQEGQTAERIRAMQPYQVNAALVEAAQNPNVIVMHCLPAHRGQEITDEVADGKHSAVFQQAENRLHAQKAILTKLMTNGASG